MCSTPITINQFIDKYDSGGGFGCGCGDCGWNKAENKKIFPSEIVSAVGKDGYDELAADFRSVENPISKEVLASYFRDTLAHDVASRLDPNYIAFRKNFDNGEGAAKGEDDLYALSEVKRRLERKGGKKDSLFGRNDHTWIVVNDAKLFSSTGDRSQLEGPNCRIGGLLERKIYLSSFKAKTPKAAAARATGPSVAGRPGRSGTDR